MSGAIEAEYDWSEVNPSTAVVETVAIAADRDPMALEPMYHWIDPDALDTLVDWGESHSDDGTNSVTFTFDGHKVTVTREGTVVVRPNETPTTSEKGARG